MLTCPMCEKSLTDLVRHCPRCGTDLSLLVDFRAHRQEGLARAEALTRNGQLAEAVWAYLAVLEVDPDNVTARRQVGQVATAVRQFDRTKPSRRWLARLRGQAGFRRWQRSWKPAAGSAFWLGIAALVLVSITCFVLGYHFGHRAGHDEPSPEPPAERPPYDETVGRSRGSREVDASGLFRPTK